jgi:deoxycytidine triphosphate deaminase
MLRSILIPGGKMPLSVDEVLEKEFVRLDDGKGGFLPSDSPKYSRRKKCSYDLSPRWIIKDGMTYDLDGSSNEQLRDLKFPPQGSLTLVSRERIVLPETHAAYAFLRTGLARKGLLAINTGIVDGGWDNHLATILINFGKDELGVGDIRGQEFLRLTFEKITGSGPQAEASEPFAKYLEARRVESKAFPPTFLDIPARMETLSKSIREDMVKTAWDRVAGLVAVLSVAAIVLSYVTPAIVNAGSKVFASEDNGPSAATQLMDLRERVAVLEGRLQISATSSAARSPAPLGPAPAIRGSTPTSDSTASTRRP